MPVDISPERALLVGRLDGQRHHVISQLEGTNDDQVRRPVLPSGWSCLALVRHLTLSDQRYCLYLPDLRTVLVHVLVETHPSGCQGRRILSHEPRPVLHVDRAGLYRPVDWVSNRREVPAPTAWAG